MHFENFKGLFAPVLSMGGKLFYLQLLIGWLYRYSICECPSALASNAEIKVTLETISDTCVFVSSRGSWCCDSPFFLTDKISM